MTGQGEELLHHGDEWLAEASELLQRTPAVLAALLDGLGVNWMTCNEGPETWSAEDVVAHLADVEEHAWISRLRFILQHGTSRPFAPIDRLGFRNLVESQDVTNVVALFAERRASNLRALEQLELSEEQLHVEGRHPTLGVVTVRQLLATWVVHDQTHIAQILRVMAKRCGVAVGPWDEHLSILRWK